VAQTFDRVWHKGFLFKLKSILPSYYYLLFKSYLENRYFTVRSGFSLFEISPIHAGVPQGSVTAPLLFNLFTSDKPTTKRVARIFCRGGVFILCLNVTLQLIKTHTHIVQMNMTKWGVFEHPKLPTTPNTTTGNFADIKALLAIHYDPKMASILIQNHLNLLSTWYKNWGIKVNETKFIRCTFTLRQKSALPSTSTMHLSQSLKTSVTLAPI